MVNIYAGIIHRKADVGIINEKIRRESVVSNKSKRFEFRYQKGCRDLVRQGRNKIEIGGKLGTAQEGGKDHWISTGTKL